MSAFEYRAVPAPRKGKSGKGMRGAPAKFANAVTALMNEMGADGWDYLRADTLPCEERQGLTGKAVKYHSMLVFRRAVVAVEESDPQPEPLAIAAPVEDDAADDDLVEEASADDTQNDDFGDNDASNVDDDSPEDGDDDADGRGKVAAE